MKHLVSIILLCSVLLFQFSELVVFLSFKINQDYIAENLCVEKDIEGSTCKGCCQLKKRINEQEQQKKEFPPNHKEKQNIDFCAQTYGVMLVLYAQHKKHGRAYYKNYYLLNINSVFHPPDYSV
ncbi:hypothetical protein [uncultured Draconibacterium sp.]|uniref:hypothetical protein n=1 Tax=uncultured Draconibacterium sp. TaxID=1573823 RepID=UPI003260AA85